MSDERTPVAEPKPKRSRRRWLMIILGIALAFVAYAFSVQATDVDLSQIKDETRREQLFRILRALAQPDLIHYDTEEILVTADLYVPCSGEVPERDLSEPYIVVEPPCGNAGDIVTVQGFGFEPEASAGLDFVPDSEFAITLTLDRFETDSEGDFSIDVELPARESENAQQIQARTKTQVGSWTNRVSVWTDANENGVEDTGEIPDSGEIAVSVLTGRVQEIGAVALVGPDNDLVQFIAFGNENSPTSGPAQGEIPFDVGEARVQTFSGDVTGNGEEVVISGTDLESDPPQVTIAGDAGTDLGAWEVVVYDTTELNRFDRTAVGDLFALSPRLSENALETWDKIIETVALAFLATTVGLMMAIPLSFLAARNLMRDISTPVTNLALNMLAFPVGLVLGAVLAGWAGDISGALTDSWGVMLIGLVVIPAAMYYTVKWAIPEHDVEPPSTQTKAARGIALGGVGFAGIVFLYLFSELSMDVGGFLGDNLGLFSFLGTFIATMGELLEAILVVISAVLGAGVLMNLAGRLGYAMRTRLPAALVRTINLPLAAAAGAVVAAIIGMIINWFYEFDNPMRTFWIPVIIGALIGLGLAVRAYQKESVGVGLVIYYAARTLFNTLRSIEPLVMGIVFVVWVGFGPFAGSLALALHTTAALAKLYSEQVESIAAGPLEAVRATGATRLQTVVYAVVPQIVPPYISFTMYRWDINVRMSTIIGFVGGGGIGFLLQQNINLLQYRAAAAQMLAIAIVVATMDYISARLRERLV
ncbi:MAG: ABC transporter permease subunit [Acidimicrobiia bacterium]|nr:ABC transporter permease subunit [Acidimicrobiia bacterium]